MSSVLSGLKIAVLGGDERELILVNELVRMGATVVVCGFPREMVGHGAFALNNLEEACKGAEVVILPLPGTSQEGVVRAVYSDQEIRLTEKAISVLSPQALIIIGTARDFLKDWVKQKNLNLMEVAEIDEIAILNSIPTAEGAIQIAMEETNFTIHGSKSCIIGFGRVGVTMARTLKALGSEVTVVGRNQGQLARAYEMGCRRAELSELQEIMHTADLAFNTVPEMMLDRTVLKYANPDVVIIDLATQPGGTDFEAANHYGLKAILAPGLPGKVAPLSAGRVLASIIPGLIIKELVKIEQASAYA
ncbi:MAG TPA: dipicolinate synthase subunit DpsA [Syntrophomonas sp.]|nr:dipicolinate synthase subunit DpsA [Syntrophomonas sp.]